MNFEQVYVHCVRNEKECVCTVTQSSGKIIKEMPGSLASGTLYTFQ